MRSRRHILVWGLGVSVLFLAAAGVARAGVIYVDDGTALGGDGLSWATAFKYLQDGLAAAGAGDEIRVAGGVYQADQDEGGNVTPADFESTIQLINGVALNGGYAGMGAPDPSERDIAVYETTLSGDLASNDDPPYSPWNPSYVDNAYQVVTGGGTDATAVIDGFTITAGTARHSPEANRGGGMYNEAGNPTVSNCTFSRNIAAEGGGMFNRSSSPTVINCKFIDNYGVWSGGGMGNVESSPTVLGCTFSGNTVSGMEGYGDGAGMSISYGNPMVVNCRFIGNYSGSNGGGMYTRRGSPTIINCTFAGNYARGWSPGGGYGGAIYGYQSNTTVINCTFVGNRTSWPGPGSALY